MKDQSAGFSIIEATIALGITLGVGVILFQAFQQNERVFRDQDLIVEAQQTARAVVAQIADEIRMAGQGVPVYASTFDSMGAESIAVFLAGSGDSRINFRAALSNIESDVTSVAPLDVTIDNELTIRAAKTSPFTNSVGKFVFLWGPASDDSWAWARAELTQVSNSVGTLRLAPRQAGDAGRTGNVVRFTSAPGVALEEAVGIYFDAGSIKRATAVNLANPANPVWSAGSEIGRGFTSLVFTYHDRDGNPLTTDSLATRMSVASVGVRLTVQTEPLSNGRRRTYTLSLRTIPRNVKIR